MKFIMLLHHHANVILLKCLEKEIRASSVAASSQVEFGLRTSPLCLKSDLQQENFQIFILIILLLSEEISL